MLADKIEALVATQVEAIKNIKIDSVVVWDSGNGEGGSTSTANFLSNMGKSIPPLQDLFKMTGLQLPEYLGRPVDSAPAPKQSKEVREIAEPKADAKTKK